MKKIFVTLIFTTALLITSLNSLSNADILQEGEDGLDIVRIAGTNRFNTSVEISKNTFESSKYAIIASGEGFADALVGGTLAAQIDIPMLLVGSSPLNEEVKNELKRLKVEHVYILGGEETVPFIIEESIKELGINIERLAGKNRVETAEIIGAKREELKGSTEYMTLYAGMDGNYFADALSAGPFLGEWANVYGIVKLIPNMNKQKQDMDFMHVFGGINSVPKGKDENRFAGNTRYETAVDVAESYYTFLRMEVDTVIIVNGEDYPDALAASSIAGVKNAPILLSKPNNLPVAVKNYIQNEDLHDYKNIKNIKNIIIIGGENSISTNVENELRNLK
ncbi:cell wall-binding repeat-containing protein [Miniphocaeibacter halophilus]|uniref:Cell wall-binding repeat-containing protein n=1 Tax=Miniphocaeibacter halophilus TaxID=2931922 RepID=A0AC61N111_9FIRM|nr:cell wall-binding repeat-containing protein [Miniphocaeibacter halophilus]QQK08621.1 cell wall-binding repeat-containing protein [Miniphocaeibacter halophilus]